MPRNPLKLKIAYLYPDFLQGFCDRANLDIFKFRAQERSIDVEIEEIKNEDKINSAKYDFYYISGSNIDMLDECNKRLKNNHTELVVASESNIPMLAINCGYILFGQQYQLNNLPPRESIGIFNTKTTILPNPVNQKIIGICNFIKKHKDIVGYALRYTMTTLEDDTKPFLSLGKGKTEGSVYNNVIGTYITSPILAHNPFFCDYLIANCLKAKYKSPIPLTKLCDDIEWYSHNYFLESK